MPLAWRSRSEPGGSLRWFVTAVALLFGICALDPGLFWGSSFRYEVDFLPALVLLAVVGIFGVERALADRPRLGARAVRWGWGLLLVFSVAFNLLASVEHYAEAHNDSAASCFDWANLRRPCTLGAALRLNPDDADAHNSLGVALEQTGRTQKRWTI